MGSRLIKRIGEQIEIKNIVWIVEFVLNKSRTYIDLKKNEEIWKRKMEEEYLRICLICLIILFLFVYKHQYYIQV